MLWLIQLARRIVGELGSPDLVAEGVRLARQFVEWLTSLNRAVRRVADGAMKNILAHKSRAETAYKFAEAEGVTYALQIVGAARRVVHGLFDPDLIAAYELALAREVFGLLRLEVPGIDTDPEDL